LIARGKNWLLILALAGVIGAALWSINLYRHRWVRRNGDLVTLLPPGDWNVIYADLGLLRRAGMLGLAAHIKVAGEREYNAFVRETDFNYLRDLDALAVATGDDTTYILGHGRFHWDRLRHYVERRQGACNRDACVMKSASPARYANFIRIQQDVLGLAVSNSASGADIMRPPGRRPQAVDDGAPVWVELSRSLLKNPSGMPIPVQIFLISLQSAQYARLYAGPAPSSRRDTAFLVHLNARFENAAAADTARRQLEIVTARFKKALTQVSGPADATSLAGLLTSGSFQVIGADTIGEWPVRKELVQSLE
jgi:hypothetical protein